MVSPFPINHIQSDIESDSESLGQFDRTEGIMQTCVSFIDFDSVKNYGEGNKSIRLTGP